jgi:tetratricopeptide (TPR) repeat protein
MSERADVERWQRARALFEQSVELDATARAALLDAECADDAALRREVESLLAADQAAAEEPTVPALAASPDLVHALLTDHADADEQRWLGIRIGAFEIERVLGRGGMGAVFLANRVDGEYAQQVAIKLIRQGYGSGSLHARLRAERQILASLAHPRIARLLDGGVAADGTPYIVMEYVDGANLLEYCHARQLSLQARLELFLSLLDAVEYAHQRLVVHRDIKPSNILVDQDGRAKLLDFGVAKLLAAEASTTAAAGAAPFTPAYAAPEQIRGETVTTAIDIYALGLVLYEVLTGARPYRVDESSPRAYEIAVLEQTPTRPSDAVRADRDIDVARVRKALRGDLDAIVLKALRKEPAQRYASVADFAADIRCHLAQRPVAARQGNFRYVAGRFLRRHAFALGLGTIALGGLIGGAVMTELQRREAVAARERAESEAARANQVTEFMVEVFEQANPEETDGAAVSAIALLESARARIDTQTMDAAARATMLIGIARAIVGVQPERITSTLTEEAVRLLRPGNNPLALAQALTAQAQSLINEKRDPEALPLLAESAALLVGDQPAVVQARRRNLRWLGFANMNMGRSLDAITLFERAFAQAGPGADMLDVSMVDMRNLHAYALLQVKRPKESRAAYLKLTSDLRATQPLQRVALAEALTGLAFTYGHFDEFVHSEAALREVVTLYGDLHRNRPGAMLKVRVNLARILMERGRYDEAEAELRGAYEAVLAVSGADADPVVLAPSRRWLAEIAWRRGRFVEAQRWADEHIAGLGELTAQQQSRLTTGYTVAAAAQIDLAQFDAAAATIAKVRTISGTRGWSLSRKALEIEALRLQLIRNETPDCSGSDSIRTALLPVYAQWSSGEHYQLAYAALCRWRSDRSDVAARAELDEHVTWLRTHMPHEDARAHGLMRLIESS